MEPGDRRLLVAQFQIKASLLFPDTTCQRNNITGRIVNNDNAGLQLL